MTLKTLDGCMDFLGDDFLVLGVTDFFFCENLAITDVFLTAEDALLDS